MKNFRNKTSVLIGVFLTGLSVELIGHHKSSDHVHEDFHFESWNNRIPVINATAALGYDTKLKVDKF